MQVFSLFQLPRWSVYYLACGAMIHTQINLNIKVCMKNEDRAF
jgi:hypothetical protein